MKEKSPAYQWYPKDILSDAEAFKLTSAQEGAYRRLLDFCWLEGSLKNDENELLALCKRDITIEDIRVVIKFFKADPEDAAKLINVRQLKERIKQAEWSKKSSAGGKKGAEKRWASKRKGAGKGGHKLATDYLSPNDSSSSPSSSSSSKFIIPKMEEVKEYFKKQKINESEGEAFFDFYTSKNWFVGKNKMKDWQAAVRNWIRNMKNPAKETKSIKGNFLDRKKYE